MRLNENGTPKQWSYPADRVDLAAHYHDLAYAQHSDTANRNVGDNIMLQQMDSIPNRAMREKIERTNIKPIIAAKAKFGLGHKQNFHKRAYYGALS